MRDPDARRGRAARQRVAQVPVGHALETVVDDARWGRAGDFEQAAGELVLPVVDHDVRISTGHDGELASDGGIAARGRAESGMVSDLLAIEDQVTAVVGGRGGGAR